MALSDGGHYNRINGERPRVKGTRMIYEVTFKMKIEADNYFAAMNAATTVEDVVVDLDHDVMDNVYWFRVDGQPQLVKED